MIEEEKIINFMKNHDELIVPSCKGHELTLQPNKQDNLIDYMISPAKEDPNFNLNKLES